MLLRNPIANHSQPSTPNVPALINQSPSPADTCLSLNLSQTRTSLICPEFAYISEAKASPHIGLCFHSSFPLWVVLTDGLPIWPQTPFIMPNQMAWAALPAGAIQVIIYKGVN